MSSADATTHESFTGPFRDSGTTLEIATLGALDRLQAALDLEPAGVDRFRAGNEADRFGRIFGGQLLAQAMTAAAATVADHIPHSIHASFVRAGASDVAVDIAVDRIRDGRSMSTRQVTVGQGGRTILTATVSFEDSPEGPADAEPTPDPESLPLLQHWAGQAPPQLADAARTWIDTPPPLEMRIAEAPTFFGGAQAPGERSHWMRLPRDVGDEPGMHRSLLTYASDYLLLDMALRSHPDPVSYGTHMGMTLDHAVWLHRPVRFDGWHRYTQRTVATGGHRALVLGSIADAAGRVVATTAQDVLVRPMTTRPRRTS